MQKVGFGGGCHWCTEAVFDSLKGVSGVLQGWISSTLEGAGNFSEAVIVRYDETKIPLDILVEIHLRTHKSTSNHSMRSKYRSAIYTFDDAQKATVEAILVQKQALFEKQIVTGVYPFKNFKSNKEAYLQYYRKHKGRAFCNNYIDPKLRLLFEMYGDYVKRDETKKE